MDLKFRPSLDVLEKALKHELPYTDATLVCAASMNIVGLSECMDKHTPNEIEEVLQNIDCQLSNSVRCNWRDCLEKTIYVWHITKGLRVTSKDEQDAINWLTLVIRDALLKTEKIPSQMTDVLIQMPLDEVTRLKAWEKYYRCKCNERLPWEEIPIEPTNKIAVGAKDNTRPSARSLVDALEKELVGHFVGRRNIINASDWIFVLSIVLDDSSPEAIMGILKKIYKYMKGEFEDSNKDDWKAEFESKIMTWHVTRGLNTTTDDERQAINWMTVTIKNAIVRAEPVWGKSHQLEKIPMSEEERLEAKAGIDEFYANAKTFLNEG